MLGGGLAYLNVYIFCVLQLAASFYAWRRGGAPERAVALLLLGAASASFLNGFVRAPGFGRIDAIRLLIDTTVLVGLSGVAVVANRYWPIWIAALHLLAIAVHGARAYDAGLVPYVYAIAVGKIAYPMLLVLVVGAQRHRHRIAEHGVDRDWSWELAR